MLKVSMLQSGIRGFANAVKRTAIKDKKFAEELVNIHGLRSDITPKSLRKIGLTKDIFDNGGKLTKEGQKEVARISKELNLPQNATWEDAFAAVRRSKENLLEIPKVKELKISEFNIDELRKLKLKTPKVEIPKLSMKEINEIMRKYHLDIDG